MEEERGGGSKRERRGEKGRGGARMGKEGREKGGKERARENNIDR